MSNISPGGSLTPQQSKYRRTKLIIVGVIILVLLGLVATDAIVMDFHNIMSILGLLVAL